MERTTFDGISGGMIYYEATGEDIFVPPTNNTIRVVFKKSSCYSLFLTLLTAVFGLGNTC